jgi:protein-tyrosine phosphatase
LHAFLLSESDRRNGAFSDIRNPLWNPHPHRAGICAATLLSALGVPWEAVMEDYLLSNVQRQEDAESALRTLRTTAARKRGISEEEVDLRQIRGLFFVDADYLGAAHDEATARYGSIQRFIREGVGWQDADLARLRDVLLE